MSVDRARAAVITGGSDGDVIVARFPGLLCVARSPDRVDLIRLLDVCAAVAGPDPGRTLARGLARWIGGPDAPGDDLVFGTVAAAGEQLGVFLVGAVVLTVPGDAVRLSGVDAATWTDRLIALPDVPVVLALDGVAPAAGLAADLNDLRSGVVPGAGVVLFPPAPAEAPRRTDRAPGRSSEPLPGADGAGAQVSGERPGEARLHGRLTGGRAAGGGAVGDPSAGDQLVGSAGDRTASPRSNADRFDGDPLNGDLPNGDLADTGRLNGHRLDRDRPSGARSDTARRNGDNFDDARSTDARRNGVRFEGNRFDDDHPNSGREDGDRLDGDRPDSDRRGGDRFGDDDLGREGDRFGDDDLGREGDRFGDDDPGHDGDRSRPAGEPEGYEWFADSSDDEGHGAPPDNPARGAAHDNPARGAAADVEARGANADVSGRGSSPDATARPWSEAPTDRAAAEHPGRGDGPAREGGAAEDGGRHAILSDVADAPDDGAAARAPGSPPADEPARPRGVAPEEVGPGPAGPDRTGPELRGSRRPAGEVVAVVVADDEPEPDRRETAYLDPGPTPAGGAAAGDAAGAADAVGTMTGRMLLGSPAPEPVRPDPRPRQHDEAAAERVVSSPFRVRGQLCERGHLNDPRATACVQCGAGIVGDDAALVIGSRPALGHLVFDDGATFLVDSEYLVGRMPDADPRARSGELTPIVVEDRSGSVSRVHAEILINGWDVVLVDSGSRNGTFISAPDDPGWTPLAPGRTSRLVPGTAVRMGGRTFVFEPPTPAP